MQKIVRPSVSAAVAIELDRMVIDILQRLPPELGLSAIVWDGVTERLNKWAAFVHKEEAALTEAESKDVVVPFVRG